MKAQSHLLRIILAVAALLLLGGLGTYWPRWIGAAPAQSTSFAAFATIGDAISYQGYLTDDNDMPLTGTFTIRFEIYNAQLDGLLLWDSGDMSVTVTDGLFAVKLDITTDIFNGEELWVAQTVNGELLTPRQEILPVPLAHSLRPGAIVKGTASAIPNNYLLDVQMNNDDFAFNRGAVFARTTTGNAIQGLAENGRAIYGQTEDGYAIYGFDGGSDANRGYGGYFYSTNGIGVYGYSGADRSHPNIYAPGLYGQSNQGIGVYGRGDTSNSYSFFNEGGYFEGGKGLFARGTDPSSEQGYGARIYSNDYRGMYIQGAGGNYDAYFGSTGGINVDHVVERNPALLIVANIGSEAIAPGDLVAMAGVVPSPLTGEPMLAVAKLDDTNAQAVIGVASTAISLDSVPTEDGSVRSEFSTADGLIANDGFLAIVTDGLAPAVNLSSVNSVNSASGMAHSASWEIGEKIEISTGGEMVRSSGDADRIIIGKVAGPIDPMNDTIPLFVNID